MSVNRFDDLCDNLDAAVFTGDWLFDAGNRAIFEEYLRRWGTELKSHGSASESNPELAALLARHNALREAVHKAMDRTADCDKKQTDDQLIADVAYLKRLASDYFKTSVDCGNRVFAVEQKYDALVEAVKKEHLAFDALDDAGFQLGAVGMPIWTDHAAARAEVDRLLQEPPC